MSIISKFNKENPGSQAFRKYIPNPGTLAAIDKYISEGKNTEAESLILRFMPNAAIVAELKAGDEVVKPAVVEPQVIKPTEVTPETVVEPEPEVPEVPTEEPIAVEETGEDTVEEPITIEETGEETGEDAVEEPAEAPAPKKKTTKKKSSK